MSDLLRDFIHLEPFAEEVNRHPRTVLNWMKPPDGLPYSWMGNQRIIHVPTAREWLMGRMRKPKRARVARLAAQQEENA
jgi:hypothetical protein